LRACLVAKTLALLKPLRHGHYLEFVLIIALFTGKCAWIFLFHAIFPKGNRFSLDGI
jgi:hypothetical protein